jgi:hypothetical protein
MKKNEQDKQEPVDRNRNALVTLIENIYIHRLPSYGNKIFYGLGFLSLTCLVLLVITGMTLAFMGQSWWLHNSWGIYVRSVHLWSVQALIAFLVLHMLVGFFSSGFKKPRRMIWVFGATIFCLALIQTEFGYGLRGDFSSQFRAVSGADFWNGAHLGYWINPLNFNQEYILHIAVIPIAILLLFIAHYLLVHTYGIARPYRADIKVTTAKANHKIMYIRGVVLTICILILAGFFHSPYVKAITVSDVMQKNPSLIASTMLQEFNHTSDTATYMDSIDPYTFDTRSVFIENPYKKITEATHSYNSYNAWQAFASAPQYEQKQYINEAKQYFGKSNSTVPTVNTYSANPVITMIQALLPAAQNGLYSATLDAENPTTNDTYKLRFLADTGIFETEAANLNMSTKEWGMAKDETGSVWKMPPGSWWLAPIGMINSTFNLLENDHGDEIAAYILFTFMILFIAFPYIPFLNRIPEFLHVAPFIWRERKRKD